MRVASPQEIQLEIENGIGEWRYVPPCVRQALALVLSTASNRRSASRSIASTSHSSRALLPLRGSGPRTNVIEAVEAAQVAEQPLARVERELLKSSKGLSKHLPKPKDPSHDGDERVCSTCGGRRYDVEMLDEKSGQDPRSCRKGYSSSSGPETRAPEKRSHMPASTSSNTPRVTRRISYGGQMGMGANSPGPVVQPIDLGAPKVKRVECVRHRREVTDVLLSVADVVKVLDKDVDTIIAKALTDAMRLDPRRAKGVRGEVAPVVSPSNEQQEALKGFTNSIRWLTDAMNELLAVFLTPEEKRFLGLDTHRYQTRRERETTYQYAKPPRRGAGVAAPPPPPSSSSGNIPGGCHDGENDIVTGSNSVKGRGDSGCEGGKSGDDSSKRNDQAHSGTRGRSSSRAPSGTDDHDPGAATRDSNVEVAGSARRSSELPSGKDSVNEGRSLDGDEVKRRLSVSTRHTGEELQANKRRGSTNGVKLSSGEEPPHDAVPASARSSGLKDSLPERQGASDSQVKPTDTGESVIIQEREASGSSGLVATTVDAMAGAGRLIDGRFSAFIAASDSDSDSD